MQNVQKSLHHHQDYDNHDPHHHDNQNIFRVWVSIWGRPCSMIIIIIRIVIIIVIIIIIIIIRICSECGSVYGEDRVAASMICAGWPEGGKDSCQVFISKYDFDEHDDHGGYGGDHHKTFALARGGEGLLSGLRDS